MANQSKDEMLENLRAMLGDVFRLRREGLSHARLARAHGYVDGFMRALIDSGLVTRQELLNIVADERRELDGPATTSLQAEPDLTADATAA